MTGIHDVFPADDNDSNDPILEKKLKQLDGEYATAKTILGFYFDGSLKRYGSKMPSAPTSSPFYMAGSARAELARWGSQGIRISHNKN